MSGGANAGVAAAANGGSGIYDRARMSKVHDELWARSDAAKLLIDSVTRRTKDLSTFLLTSVAHTAAPGNVTCTPLHTIPAVYTVPVAVATLPPLRGHDKYTSWLGLTDNS